MTNFVIKIAIAGIAGLVMFETGCSRAPALSPAAAAQLAATLANEQCDRLYQQQPFSSSQHQAHLQKGTYEWGGFDPAGPEGYSALVSFRADGRAPHVEIYFSCDPQFPLTRPPSPQLPLSFVPHKEIEGTIEKTSAR